MIHSKSIFSEEELRRRYSLFSDGLAAENIDVAFLSTTDHIFYISGVPLIMPWGRPMWALVYPHGKSCLVGALGEKENMEEHTFFDEIRMYGDDKSALDGSLELVIDYLNQAEKKPKRIGIETGYLTVPVYNMLISLFPDVEFVDISAILFKMRMVKSEEECAIMRILGQVAKIGAAAYIDAAYELRTELAIASHATAEMNKALAALYPKYNSAMSNTYTFGYTGDNGLCYHNLPTNRRVKHGDTLPFVVMPNVWGYQMELGRTFFVGGDPSDEQLKALEAVTKANELGRELYREGTVAADISNACYDYLRECGYTEKDFRHGAGHALGLLIGPAGREEMCEVRSYNKNRLKAGMILNCEPGLYIPELGGCYRHVDTMIVGKDGNELLTDFIHDVNGVLGYDTYDFKRR